MRAWAVLWWSLWLSACLHEASSPQVADDGGWRRPAADARFAIQLLVDEAHPLRRDWAVDVFELDLFDTDPATIAELKGRGMQVVCYFSAGSYEDWRPDAADFPDEILGNDYAGWPGERWLDIRDPRLRPILEARLDLAREKGCDGVDPDNVDGYMVDTGFPLTPEDQLEFNRWLAESAHARGLFVVLKNAGAQAAALVDHFDAVVAEQCDVFDECGLFAPFIAQGKPVWDLEYRQDRDYDDPAVFQAMCRATSALGVQAAYYPLELDGSFRRPCDPDDALRNGYAVGLGDRAAWPLLGLDGEAVWWRARDLILADGVVPEAVADLDATALADLDRRLNQVGFLVLWATPGWQPEWFDPDGLAELLNSGVAVVIQYWYFGDRLLAGLPDAEAQAAYLEDAARLGRFLAELPAPVWVSLEPEFNKAPVLADPEGFAQLLLAAMDMIRAEAPETRFLLTLTDDGERGTAIQREDCGHPRCALGDEAAWGRYDAVIEPLAERLSALGFQEMVAQFSRDPSDPGTWEAPRARRWDPNEVGLADLPDRVLNFTRFLHRRWGKPVLLPYLTVATATWTDADGDGRIDAAEIDPRGWEAEAQAVYAGLQARAEALREAGLLGWAPMALLDDPAHDAGGYQYFLDNEYHLGLVASGARPGVDAYPDGALRDKGALAAVFPLP